MFHFYVSTYWLSTLFKAETYNFYISLLVSMFSLKKELGIAKVICKPPVLVPQTAQKSYLSKLGEMAHV